jgi:hypothetical protein
MNFEPKPELKTKVNALQMIDPAAGHPSLLLQGARRIAASAVDLAPQAHRPGSDQATACPSRTGSKLHYRCGRVTDLDGNPA